MYEYRPDKWIIIQITRKDDGKVYDKVFATWSGGYFGEDRWRMNSGIDNVTEDNDYYYFHGGSGSVYKCHKNMNGVTVWGSHVLNDFMNKPEYNIEIIGDYVSYIKTKQNDKELNNE